MIIYRLVNRNRHFIIKFTYNRYDSMSETSTKWLTHCVRVIKDEDTRIDMLVRELSDLESE